MCEGFTSIMGNIRACRVCLVSGVKLYNMYKYNLQFVYEDLTGLSVSKLDKHPHYLCVNCQHMLVKSYSFKEMCIRSHNLFESAAIDPKTLATENLTPPISLSNSSMSLVVINPEEEPATVEISEAKVKDEYLENIDSDLMGKKIKKEDHVPSNFEYGDDAFTVAQNVEYSEFETENVDESKDFTEFDNMEIVEYRTNDTEQETEVDAELNKNVEIIVLSKEQQLEEIMSRKEMVNYQKAYYKCDLCYKGFMTDATFRNHMAKHDPGTPIKLQFICLVCKTNFKTMDALTSHNDISKNETCDPDLSYCTQCGDNFESQELLKVHMKSHNKELIRCDDCNRTFTKERSLAIHYQRVHLGIKFKKSQQGKNSTVAVCEVCGKECKTNSLLICHQRIHTGEKPYPCMECPKRFSVQQRLQLHMRTHTGERPYNCAHCPKAFKHKAALNRHNRVHTGDKPYICPHCFKAFSQSNSMKLHVNTVHFKMPAPYKSKRNKHHED